ncbi:MAG: SPOR domain-containing protein [Leptospirales bacterium]|nr:SPOR domain-containing protein [Leptospirales bacterium]
MENFDPKPHAVKEKNLYVVHLDTPRIIILSSVIIGIITAAFLLGMTFMKDDKHDPINLANSSMNFDENRAADILRTDIPPMPIEGEDYSSIEDRIASTDENKSNAAVNSGNSGNIEENKTSNVNTAVSGGDEVKHDKGDILTNANIKEIIPPASEKDKPVKQEKKIAKNTGNDNKKVAAKDNKKDNTKLNNVNEKGKVYGVSRNVDVKKNQGIFSVQVASYDNISRAEHERSVLKSKRFDAYIDKGLVNGKNFFRLRVGPVSSSKEAYSLLNELQSDSRYSESYIVIE